MRIDAIKIGNNPLNDVNVILGCRLAASLRARQAAGMLVVDRFLHTPMRYPGSTRFVPHTLSEDGDPIDMLVVNTRPIVPGAINNVRPVGVLKMQDEAGSDEKFIAGRCPSSPSDMSMHEYTDLPDITLQQMRHFFEHDKDLEPGKRVKVLGWGNAAEAKKMIADAIARAKNGDKHG